MRDATFKLIRNSNLEGGTRNFNFEGGTILLKSGSFGCMLSPLTKLFRSGKTWLEASLNTREIILYCMCIHLILNRAHAN